MKNHEIDDAKFIYYKKYIYYLMIIIAFSSAAYYASDCAIFGCVETITVFPRFMVFIPMVLFIVAFKKNLDRRLVINLAYIICHAAIIGTIWSCYYLPDLSFASDGFVILMFMFVAMGFAMPVPYTIYWQGLIFFEYLLAQPFVHFPDLPMMIVLGIPVYLGNIAMTIAMEHTFEDQYANKKALEFAFSHDPLTNCYNRNLFADPKLGFIEDFAENFSQYTFLLYDLDDFKNINDTYGHDVGDQILRLVTEAVRKELKDDDFIVRWGGEEFLVVTKGDTQQATDLAHDMNKAVEAIEYEGLGVTISIGIANGVSNNYRETIKAADNAMYKAKAEGKNKACW